MTRKRKSSNHILPFRGTTFFVLSKGRLDYRELRFFRTKVLLSGFLMGLLTLGVLLIANHYANDLFGLGYNQMAMISTENRLLKDQLTSLLARVGSIQKSIDRLAEDGNELRLMVDLSTLDSDTRAVGTGGSEEDLEFSFLTAEANDILSRSQQLMDELSREVQLQKASYEEIYRKYEQNKFTFTHLPAIKPMDGYYSVHGFGMRVHPVLGINRMHEGIDIIGDVGTPVYAAGHGIVRYAGRTGGGYGSVIEISHGYGYSTLYAHLSKVYVRPGQAVKRGDRIARSGRSGLVSGPHLHYEVKYNGRKMNPVDYFFDDVDAGTYRAQLSSVASR
jgi:murein DD-endopeptidase MepM/ murein hydrolase activator NlpD